MRALRYARGIVVEDDAAAIAQPQALHAAGELFGGGQHHRQIAVGIAQLAEIHEYGAGDVRSLIFRCRIATQRGVHISGIDDPQVACAHLCGQPFGRHQRVHHTLSIHVCTFTLGLRWGGVPGCLNNRIRLRCVETL